LARQFGDTLTKIVELIEQTLEGLIAAGALQETGMQPENKLLGPVAVCNISG
jgi:predicted RNase H-like HicB family nuclease